MVGGREAIIFLTIFLVLMSVALSILAIIADCMEKRSVKKVAKLAKSLGFCESSDIASLCKLRVHIREQIEECEECAENYRALLEEIEEAIKNMKYK